jgi:hypothetical protein
MGYVTIAEAPNYGASTDVTQNQLDQAAVVVNSFCGKPDGFLVEMNNGDPVCMAHASPSFSYQSLSPLSAGANVQASLPQWIPITIGDALIIDRGTATAECVIVTTINANGSVVFASVKYNHATPLCVGGLVITEEKRVSAKGIYPLRRSPLVSLFSLCANSLQIQRPKWIDGTRLDLTMLSGEMVKACYLAGYTKAPEAIKSATVLVANQMAELVTTGATNFKSEEYGGRKYERFAGVGFIDSRIAQLLAPYKAVV